MLRVSMCVLSYTPLALAGQGAVNLGVLVFSSLKIDDKGSNVNNVDHMEALIPDVREQTVHGSWPMNFPEDFFSECG